MLSTGRMPIDDPARQPERGPRRYEDEEIEELVEFVASLGDGPPIPDVAPEEGDVAAGALLYIRMCAPCHSSGGTGTALATGVTAPPVLEASPLEIAEAIRIGGAGTRSGTMPVFDETVVDEHQLDSIVRYVLHLQEAEGRGGRELGRVGPIVEGLVGWVLGLGLLVLAALWMRRRA